MHICFITDEYPVPGLSHGGIGTFVYALAHSLTAQGIEVSVVGLGKSDEDYWDEKVHLYNILPSKRKVAKFYDYFKRMDAKIKAIHEKQPISIVEGAELSLAWLTKIKDIKYVIRLHGGHNFFTKLLKIPTNRWRSFQEKKSFKKADHFVAVTQFVLDGTRKYLPIPEGRATKIFCPVDANKFYASDKSKMVPFKIFFAGTVTEKKGVRQLVLAMPIIKKKFPQVTLDIYGRDWINPDGKSYIESLKPGIDESVKNVIHFKGAVLHEELPSLYETAHVCAFPSHMETQGLVVLEAMSMGKAVLFSEEGPGPETIDHLKDGLIVNPFSPEDIAEKIIYLFEHAGLETELGNRARNKILERYDLPVITKKNVELYQALTK